MSEGAYTIELRGLRVLAILGVLPEERHRPQPLRLDLDVEIERPGHGDDVATTVDYAALCDAAAATLAARRRQLLETACDDVGLAVLAADPAVAAVTVTVAKLRPPVGHDLATAGVRRRFAR